MGEVKELLIICSIQVRPLLGTHFNTQLKLVVQMGMFPQEFGSNEKVFKQVMWEVPEKLLMFQQEPE